MPELVVPLAELICPKPEEGNFFVEESLLKRTVVPVVVRSGLYLNGSPVGIADLEDVRLTIASVDHDGVSTTKEVKDFELFEDRESIYEFQVPPRLAQLTFTGIIPPSGVAAPMV